ncbi:Uncharacterised protein [Achromobacter sp. 2789STDY5608615]|nr:Uncharacterised protein [Achromobacter sp. 2789STDY5608621]CUK22841.1 Uncharacterised protein [Achromobacter sp. 2789STDY5608615]
MAATVTVPALPWNTPNLPPQASAACVVAFCQVVPAVVQAPLPPCQNWISPALDWFSTLIWPVMPVCRLRFGDAPVPSARPAVLPLPV